MSSEEPEIMPLDSYTLFLAYSISYIENDNGEFLCLAILDNDDMPTGQLVGIDINHLDEFIQDLQAMRASIMADKPTHRN